MTVINRHFVGKLTNMIVVAKIAIMEQSKQNDQFATKSDIREFGDELKIHMQEFGNKLETHMGVLFERASEQTSLLAEQLQDTNHQVGKIKVQADRLGERVGSLELKMDVAIEAIGDVKVVVNEIKDGLDNKVDKKDFVKLEKQVIGLVAKV